MAVIGLAVLSVLISKKANTAGVIQSAASGLANDIGVATAPVTGQSVSYDTSYPSGDFSSSFGSSSF
jgi:hypothetical protein